MITSVISVYGQSEFKEYKGKFVEFQYPVEWESLMKEGLETKGVFTEGLHIPKDNRISFEIPYTQGAITILIDDTDKKNLEEILQEEIKSYSGLEDLGIKQQILEITDTTVSNEPAKKLIVNSEEFDTNLDNKILSIITLHNNKKYSITYLMEKYSYENYIPTIEKIIQSVKFTLIQ